MDASKLRRVRDGLAGAGQVIWVTGLSGGGKKVPAVLHDFRYCRNRAHSRATQVSDNTAA